MALIVGLDLGQAADYTALVILERIQPEKGEDGRYPPKVYEGRHLQRFRLGTSYPTIVEEVGAMMRTPTLQGADLVVDATGVGRPVVDMFRKARLHPTAITITGGGTPSMPEDDWWNVPKRDLVSTMQVLLQAQRLKIAKALPDAKVLTQELLNFQTKITIAANDTYGAWREGTHDDLVLATALAAWYGEYGQKPRVPGSVLVQAVVKGWGY